MTIGFLMAKGGPEPLLVDWLRTAGARNVASGRAAHLPYAFNIRGLCSLLRERVVTANNGSADAFGTERLMLVEGRTYYLFREELQPCPPGRHAAKCSYLISRNGTRLANFNYHGYLSRLQQEEKHAGQHKNEQAKEQQAKERVRELAETKAVEGMLPSSINQSAAAVVATTTAVNTTGCASRHRMPTYYINLANRTQRRAEIETELGAAELNYTRIKAFKSKRPILGCAISHVAALEAARRCASSARALLVFEDDFHFNGSSTAVMRRVLLSLDMLERRNVTWHAILLAYNLVADARMNESLVEHTPGLVRLRDARTTSAYMVHPTYVPQLLSLAKASVRKLGEGMHMPSSRYAMDVAWKRLMARDRWYRLVPRAGTQRAGISDIAQGKWHDYGVR